MTPVNETLHFKTQLKVPRVGVMLVGLGGNNGSTVAAGIIANKQGLTWNTKVGVIILKLHASSHCSRERCFIYFFHFFMNIISARSCSSVFFFSPGFPKRAFARPFFFLLFSSAPIGV